MRRADWILGIVILAGAAAAAEPQFRLHGSLQPLAGSTDGRYSVSAYAERTAPAPRQRYTLKQVSEPAAICAPGDGLYADGFEG